MAWMEVVGGDFGGGGGVNVMSAGRMWLMERRGKGWLGGGLCNH